MSAPASVSIDIDGIACYHAIHGLAPPVGDDPIYTKAMPRFLELVDKLGISATLFAVGRDAEQSVAAALLKEAVDQGHEIGNHSYSHDYRLSVRGFSEIVGEVVDAHKVLERVTGVEPRGFRAPGYNISEPVIDALEAQGYLYDSSVFPSPAYFALRAGAIALYRLRKQVSRSLAGDLRQFTASRFPYQPSEAALHRSGAGDARSLVELPIAVVPHLRLPYIGTSLTMLSDRAGALLTRGALATRAPLVLELHAIDFLDRNDPGVEPGLVQHQRDLVVPLGDKLRRLEKALRALTRARPVERLDDLALRYRSA